MSRRILTPDEAFEAGFSEPCQHLVPDPNDCPDCRLTDSEIRRLALLLRSPTPAQDDAITAAA